MNRCAVETILSLASCISGHAQECKVRVLQLVNDDLGNHWKAGSVLSVHIERTGSQGNAFCASRGSCLPRTVQGSDALVLLNCRKGAALGDGDFRLIASAIKTGRAAASAIERRQDVADKLSKLGFTNASAGSLADDYVNLPQSKNSQLVARALAGSQAATVSLKRPNL